MTKPKRVKCQVAGCVSGELDDNKGVPGPYWTDPDCCTIAERTGDLKDHVHMVHELAIEQVTAQASKISAEAEKLKAEADKLKAETLATGSGDSGSSSKGKRRALMIFPVIEEGVTESDWSFFLAKWVRYSAATEISGGASIRHL